MSFVEKLKIKWEEKIDFYPISSPGMPYGLRFIEHLNIDNEYKLSIQASSSAYCIPRAFLPLDKYTHFEIAILYQNEFAGTSVYDDFYRKEELLQYYEGSVYQYVPKDLIEDLYIWLKEQYN